MEQIFAGNDVSIEIFSPEFIPLSPLEKKTAIRWNEKFANVGEFELWCPITDLNVSLLVEGNYVWIGRDTAGLIEYLQKSMNDSNELELHVKGRLTAAMLERRVVYPTFNGKGQASTVMNKLVDTYVVNPKDKTHAVTGVFLRENGAGFGGDITYQQTGSDVLTETIFLAEANNIGFRFTFDPWNKKQWFEPLKPTNRTWSQTSVPPVVFDSDSNEILSSDYTINYENGRNVAIVAGEGEGADRKWLEVSNCLYARNYVVNSDLSGDVSNTIETNGGGQCSLLTNDIDGRAKYNNGRTIVLTSNATLCDAWCDYTIINTQAGHKIYGAAYVSVNNLNATSVTDRVFTIAGRPSNRADAGVTYDTVVAKLREERPADNFVRVSSYLTIPSGDNRVRAVIGGWGNIPSGLEFIYNNMMMIDLTEMFGAGNEPTKEWCDQYIDFFHGSQMYDTIDHTFSDRRELWVDAKDIQSTDDEGFAIPEADYTNLLKQRGLQKLSEYKYVENFLSTVKTFGYQQNVFGKDYFLGDYVTVINHELQLTINTQITEVEQTWDDKGYKLDITFGNAQPTILDIVKRK